MSELTVQGKKVALEDLKIRRSNKPEQFNNSRLPAGAPMYWYCEGCGHLSDILPESYITTPKKLCKECKALKECGWLE